MISINKKYKLTTMVNLTLVVFAFFIFQLPLYAETNNEIKQPDFAYPQTVIENAEVLLDKASNERNSIDMVKAILQIVIAKNQISKSNVTEMLHLIDSVAKTQQTDFRAILHSIEAELYYSIYINNRYLYDQRNVSQIDFPTDPTLWDKDIFALKINELVMKSLSETDSLLNSPITNYSEILVDLTEDCIIFYPTLYDLLAYRGLSMLSEFSSDTEVIPFFSYQGKKTTQEQTKDSITNIITTLKTMHWKRNEIAPYIEAVINTKVEYNSNLKGYREYLVEEFESNNKSEYSIELLLQLVQLTDNNEEKFEYCRLLKEQIRIFPEYIRIKTVKSIIDNIESPTISLSVDNAIHSQTPVKISGIINNIDSVYLQIYKKPKNFKDEYQWGSKISYILPEAQLVKVIKYDFVNEKPFSAKIDTLISGLDYGHYFIVPANGPMKSDVVNSITENQYETFQITDLKGFNTYIRSNNHAIRIYVVDSHSGKPIENAFVQLYENDQKKDHFFKATTNKNGYVEVPDIKHLSFNIRISRGDDSISFYSFTVDSNNLSYNSYWADILTDLAIYKPGDTLKFAVVAHQRSEERDSILRNQNLKVILQNASHECIDTLKITTDSTGRANGKFTLPKQGLNGTYYLYVENFISRKAIRVEEYRPPTFYIELNDIKSNYSLGDTINISGIVKTYSGMPVANADMKFDIRYQAFANNLNCYYACDSQSDSCGYFNIKLPTKNLNSQKYLRGSYTLSIIATSAMGESVEAAQNMFCVGQGFYIETDEKYSLFADKEYINIPVRVKNMLNKEVSKELTYVIKNCQNNKIKFEGLFTSPILNLNVENIPSGEYTIEFSMPNDTLVDAQSAKLIIQRETDKRPPLITPLWLTQKKIIAEKNAKQVDVKVGSSYNNLWVLCEIVGKDGFLSRKWLKIDNKYHTISVDTPTNGEITELNFITIRNGLLYNDICRVYPSSINDDLQIKVETFRDKITPNTNETWRFRFEYADKPVSYLPALATMSDKALNALIPFIWDFEGLSKKLILNIWNLVPDINYSPNYHFNFRETAYPDNIDIINPQINTYGENLYGKYYMGISRGRTLLKFTNEVRVYCFSAKAEESESTSNNDEDSIHLDNNEENNRIEYRPTECPTAFFYPSLTADENGVVDVSFEVPDFNTTWQFQILGYTDDLYAKLYVADATSSKPVMVKSNLPRFLRTGDNAVLQATIYNNSEEERMVSGRVELFDPLTNEIIQTKDFASEEMSPMGSRVIEIDFYVGNTNQFVGYRVYAISGNYTDGEQEWIPILPSSSPIIESIPFYLGVRQTEYAYELPEFNADAKVTFNYCENPIWYCITALPEFQNPQSSNISSQIDAYFINCMARGLYEKYPQIKDAINEWNESGDSILISNLQKNEDLKNVLLENTPWIQDAKSESLRMQNLASMFDYPNNESKVNKLLNNIIALQANDGGWSWCASMPSSVYMTTQVLHRLAMLKERGFLTDYNQIEENIESAISFCDNEFAKYNKEQYQYNSVPLINYLYIRSCFNQEVKNTKFSDIKENTIKNLKINWRKLSKYDQATSAMLLHKEGYVSLSREILESLNQNALYSEEKGCWFDNLSGANSLLTTKQVLLAYTKIDSDNKNIDLLRQWLIMQRQAQNWGDTGYTIEVIYAILSAGTEWLDPSDNSSIYIGNEPIAIPKDDINHTGQFSISLNAEDVGGKTLSISRISNQPTWGSVISQYVEPMQNIVAKQIPDLSISKKIYTIQNSNDGTYLVPSDTLNVGDKVRVELIIECERDMEYVSIVDQRAACMSPIEQLSRYQYQDGIGAYREVRNSNNNIFIHFLPKGTHILTYDCFITQKGTYSIGMASAQSNYAPELVAHSAAGSVYVK